MTAIVVGVDRTEASREGLRWAISEAARRGAELTAVHVISAVPNIARIGYPESRGADEAQISAARQTIAATVADEVRRTGEYALSVEVRVYVGDIVGELVNASADADLLVVTAHDGPLHRIVLGSVCRAVVAKAHCPVVVVPRGVHAEGPQAAGAGATRT